MPRVPLERKYISPEGDILKHEFNIIRGANNCDLDEIKGALQEDPECINQTDPGTGMTALHICAGHGHLTCVNFLLKQDGIDAKLRDHFQRLPQELAYAIGREDIEQAIGKVAWAELDAHLAEFAPENPEEAELPPDNVTQLFPKP